MRRDFTNETSKEIRRQRDEWMEKMFTGAKGKTWDVNTVMAYSPLIQMLNSELTGRFVKRATMLALFISLVALGVSLGAYQATKTPHIIQLPHAHSY